MEKEKEMEKVAKAHGSFESRRKEEDPANHSRKEDSGKGLSSVRNGRKSAEGV